MRPADDVGNDDGYAPTCHPEPMAIVPDEPIRRSSRITLRTIVQRRAWLVLPVLTAATVLLVAGLIAHRLELLIIAMVMLLVMALGCFVVAIGSQPDAW
jgi:hypothetical protein